MRKKGYNRRDFVKTGSLGILGGYLTLKSGHALAGMMGGGGMGGGGMGGGGMGGGGVIDPHVGNAFRDPAVMPIAGPEIINGRNVFTVNLEAKNASVDIDGFNTVKANLLTYNGCFPGPTITVRQGDILRVNFTNNITGPLGTNLLGHLRGPTNLHSHGWHVSPNPILPDADPPVYSDFVMYSLPPSVPGKPSTVIHQYDLSKETAGGFHFYHPHLHGISAEQYWAGLAGVLITEDATAVFKDIKTHIMVLKDISLSGSDPAPHDTMMDYMHGKEGDIVMVNGQVNPRLSIQPGEVQRWRILNASNARWYKLSLTNHYMYLVGTDGNLLDKSYARSQILLSPGERVDILVKASATKADYKFLSLPYSRMGMMTSAQVTLLTMSVAGDTAKSSINPSTLKIDSNIKRLNLDLRMFPQRTLQLSMGQGQGYINGIAFQDMNHAYTIESMVPSYEVWTVTNASGMDHPFHQHVDRVQVLALSGADSSYPPYASMPAWKDVVMIPKMGSAKLLVPIKDFPGMTMFHCHILEHEDIGMMGVWDRMDMSMPM